MLYSVTQFFAAELYIYAEYIYADVHDVSPCTARYCEHAGDEITGHKEAENSGLNFIQAGSPDVNSSHTLTVAGNFPEKTTYKMYHYSRKYVRSRVEMKLVLKQEKRNGRFPGKDTRIPEHPVN